MGVRVLIVEDDDKLGSMLRSGLEEEGFRVDFVRAGDDAIAAASASGYDVISLDVMIPQLDGLEVCHELRRTGVRTPILLLTGREAVDDRVRGLEAGADDYLVKPFAFEEYIARLRALARRHLADRSAVITLGSVRLDTHARRVSVGGRPLGLTGKELAILEFLMHNPGRLVSREQIAEHAWSYDYVGDSNLVEVYIGRLRRKLAAAGEPDAIHNVRGVGYRLQPASWISSERPASA